MHEKCPNREFFLVCIFLYSVKIQENADQKVSVLGHFPRSDGELPEYYDQDYRENILIDTSEEILNGKFDFLYNHLFIFKTAQNISQNCFFCLVFWYQR